MGVLRFGWLAVAAVGAAAACTLTSEGLPSDGGTAPIVEGSGGSSGGTGGSLWAGGGTGGLPPETGGAGPGGAPDLPVPCNGAPCATGDFCCHDGDGPDGDICDGDGSCSGGAKPISCAGPAWCDRGTVCCATMGGNDGIEVVECRRTCDGDNDVVMCEGDPTDCGPGFTCMPSALLGAGYATCVGL